MRHTRDGQTRPGQSLRSRHRSRRHDICLLEYRVCIAAHLGTYHVCMYSFSYQSLVARKAQLRPRTLEPGKTDKANSRAVRTIHGLQYTLSGCTCCGDNGGSCKCRDLDVPQHRLRGCSAKLALGRAFRGEPLLGTEGCFLLAESCECCTCRDKYTVSSNIAKVSNLDDPTSR